MTKSAGRMMAAPSRVQARPAFIVEKLPGMREQKVIKILPDGKRKETLVEVDAGYLVTISKGDSVRIGTLAELHRLGLDDVVPMVDDDGEVQGYLENPVAELEGAK